MKGFTVLFACILLIFFAQGYPQSTYNKTIYFYGDSVYTLNSVKGIVKDDSNIYLSAAIVDIFTGQNLIDKPLCKGS